MGVRYDAVLRTKDKLRMRDGAGSSGSIPSIFRIRGTFTFTGGIAEYPKAVAATAVNATQTGDGSGVGPAIQSGDMWVSTNQGLIGPSSTDVTAKNLIVALVDNATNADADWTVLESGEMDVIDMTWANANAAATAGTLIRGNYYRITDRFNMIIQAVSTTEFASSSFCIIPAATYGNVIDEVVMLHYRLPDDRIYYWKDLRDNWYEGLPGLFGFLDWATWVGSTLPTVQFGYASINANSFRKIPNMSTLVGSCSENDIQGNLFLDGFAFYERNSIKNVGSVVAQDSTFAVSTHVGHNAVLELYSSSAASNTTIDTSAEVYMYDTSTLTSSTVSDTATVNLTLGGFVGFSNIGTRCDLSVNDAIVFGTSFEGGYTYTINNSGTSLIDCEVSGMSITINSGSHQNKIIESGFSNFELLVDVDTLVANTLDLTAYNYVGVVRLYSSGGSLSYNLDKVIITQSNHSVYLRPNAGFTLNYNGVNKALPPAADDILVEGPAGYYALDGNYQEYVIIKREPGTAYNFKQGGVQFS